MSKKPDWWPSSPYPKDIFPMKRKRYPEIVPDPDLRTGLSGMLGREFWEIASEAIWDRLQLEIEKLCPDCGETFGGCGLHSGTDRLQEEPAPAQAELPAGKFTTNFPTIEILEILDGTPDYSFAWLRAHLREACERLDAQQQEIERLKKTNESLIQGWTTGLGERNKSNG